MFKREDYIEIGKFGKCHGILGELNLLFIDETLIPVENVENFYVGIDGYLVPYAIEWLDILSDEKGMVKLNLVTKEEKAKPLVGMPVFIDRKDLDKNSAVTPRAWNGYLVEDKKLGVLGKVVGFLDYPGNPLLEIETDKGDEILIPVNPDLIIDVQPKKKKITTLLPEGFLGIFDE